jgi:RNA ligase/AAA domain
MTQTYSTKWLDDGSLWVSCDALVQAAQQMLLPTLLPHMGYGVRLTHLNTEMMNDTSIIPTITQFVSRQTVTQDITAATSDTAAVVVAVSSPSLTKLAESVCAYDASLCAFETFPFSAQIVHSVENVMLDMKHVDETYIWCQTTCAKVSSISASQCVADIAVAMLASNVLDRLRWHMVCGFCYMQLENWKCALHHARECVDVDESHTKALELMAKCLFQLEQVTHAREVFERLTHALDVKLSNAKGNKKKTSTLRKRLSMAQKHIDRCDVSLTELYGRPVPDNALDGFPSISHLPFSPQVHSDDTKLPAKAASIFVGRKVIISEKLDGGNCCLYGGKVYARTHKHEASHPWFSPIKSMYSSLYPTIPPEYRPFAVFGECMVAIHSIEYDKLNSYFYVFAVFDQNNLRWLSWEEVKAFAARLSLPMAPTLFEGEFKSSKAVMEWMQKRANQPSTAADADAKTPVCPEGFVIRIAGGFSQDDFSQSMAKYVRKGHVQTDDSFRRTWKKATVVELSDSHEPEHSDSKLPSDTKSSSSELSESSSSSPSKAAVAVTKKLTKQQRKEAQQQAKLRKSHMRRAPKMIVMVGLPASGKSTFAEQLETSSDGAWVRICRDDMDSKAATEELCARVALGKMGGNKRCLLDGCHVTPETRKYWLDIAMRPQAVAIFFNTPVEECKRRAAIRKGHATGDLFSWGGNRIIDSKFKKLVPPTINEGFEKVYEVHTTEEANSLLVRMGGASFDEKHCNAFTVSGNADNNSTDQRVSDTKGTDDVDPSLCSEGKIMDQSTLLSRLNLKDDDVDNIYVYGSRLWGTAGSSSDFDFIIVRKSDCKKQVTHVGATIDATIMGRREFGERLARGDFLHVMCAFMPQYAIWRERWNIRKSWALNKAKLCQSVLTESKRDLAMAWKHFGKGAVDKGRKILSHTLRMLKVTCELVDHDSIGSLSTANFWHYELLSMYDREKAAYEARIATVLEAWTLKLTQVADQANGGQRHGRKRRK